MRKFIYGPAEPRSRTMGQTTSPVVRWLVVASLVIVTAGFLTSHLRVLDVEFMDVDVSSSAVQHTRVFDFKMWNTLKIFWLSGGLGVVLALLLAFCSVVLVYAKILTMLILWISPLSDRITSSLLFALDESARFSFLDIFVAGLSQTGLRISMRGVVLVGSIDIGVAKQAQAYIFASTAIVTLLLSQLLLHFHRVRVPTRAIEERLLDDVATDSGLAEVETETRAPVVWAGRRLLLRVGNAWRVRVAAALATLATIVLTCVGCIALPAFKFEYGGVFARYMGTTGTVMHTAVGAGVNLASVNYITPAEIGATVPGAIYITVIVWIMVTVVLQCTMLVLALPLLLLPIGKSPALAGLHVSSSVSAAVAALRARSVAREPRRAIGWREAARAVTDAAGCASRPLRPGDTVEPEVVRWERRVAAKEFFLHAHQVRSAPHRRRARTRRAPQCLRPVSPFAACRVRTLVAHSRRAIHQLAAAWAGLDVFCVAVGIQLLSLDRIAVEILKVQPDSVKELLAAFCGDEDCVHIYTTFLPGYWACATAAIAGHAIRIYARTLASDELRHATAI